MRKNKKCFLLLLILIIGFVSCGKGMEKESKTVISQAPVLTATLFPSARPTETSVPTQIPKEAKKTIEECLRGLLVDKPENLQADYFREGKIKYNKLSAWKDAKGNYHCPKGYEICYMPTTYDIMAAQQMPRELLDEIDTEELFQLIMNLPGDWSSTIMETYLDMVSRYYLSYNFMTEFIRRKDSAKVVHLFYQKYSKAERNKYTKNTEIENYRKGYEDTMAELNRQERFQLVEGLEWFFRYKDGKKVPNERCLGLGCMGHY